MMETDRVLRPLREAEPAIDRLDTYESPAVLGEALRATWQAVERALRNLLRADGAAPDSVRMAALSPVEMTLDAVVSELRRRDRISLQLAGRLHELTRSVERLDVAPARAADADIALDVVQWLRAEVHALGDAPVRAAAHSVVEADALGSAVHPVEAHRPRVPRPLLLASLAAVLLLGSILAVLLFGRSSDMDEGITAFRAERYGVAEERFRSALGRNPDNVSALLYLARILRSQGRHQEVAGLLRRAAEVAPRDAAVRRELGYLFLDLNQPGSAVGQFRIAVEHEPDEQLNWVGLLEAMYRAEDPAADEWLSRAPPAAQAMIRTGRR